MLLLQVLLSYLKINNWLFVTLAGNLHTEAFPSPFFLFFVVATSKNDIGRTSYPTAIHLCLTFRHMLKMWVPEFSFILLLWARDDLKKKLILVVT